MIVWTTQLHISTVNGYPSPVTDGDVIVYGSVTMGTFFRNIHPGLPLASEHIS